MGWRKGKLAVFDLLVWDEPGDDCVEFFARAKVKSLQSSSKEPLIIL